MEYRIFLVALFIALNLNQAATCSEPLKATVQMNDRPSSIMSAPIAEDMPLEDKLFSGETVRAMSSSDNTTENAQADAKQNKSSIDMTEKVKPLDPLLCPGNYFDKTVATALSKDKSISSNTWKKIPAWQAGNWETNQATGTRAIQYIDGKPYALAPRGVYRCNFRETLGWQRDKNGDIWDRYAFNYWTETDFDDYKSFSYIKFRVPGVDDYPNSYGESTDFDVDNETKKIIDVKQCKTWIKISYIAPGIIKEDSVATVYDKAGLPVQSAWNTSIQKRVEPFFLYENSVCDSSYTNKQIHGDFVNYLKNNGLAKLIPTGKELGLPTNNEIHNYTQDEVRDFRAFLIDLKKALAARNQKIANRKTTVGPVKAKAGQRLSSAGAYR